MRLLAAQSMAWNLSMRVCPAGMGIKEEACPPSRSDEDIAAWLNYWLEQQQQSPCMTKMGGGLGESLVGPFT